MNRLLHAARKLRKMPATEVTGRIRQQLRQTCERRSYRKAKARPRFGALHRGIAETALARAPDIVPGCRRSSVEEARHDGSPVFREIQAQALARADGWVSGRFHLLGMGVDLSRTIDWHRDPCSGLRWPRVFYADMELYEPSGDIDVKQVWERNRHQFLAEIARGWLCGGPDRYAALVTDAVSGWIADNPPLEGVNWTSGLEVAMRSLSWTWILAATAEWSDWPVDVLQRMVTSLHEHGSYLSRHLSFYSSPYNHLIGEATALFVLSRLLADTKEASAWEKVSRDVLTDHGQRQFYSDGFCVEQAMGYHFFTLGFLAHAVAVARTSGRPLDALEAVVHRAFQAGMALRQPDGRWPAVGDVDSARSLPVLTEDDWDFRGLCNLGATLFDDPALKLDSCGSELFWVTGNPGLRAWTRLRCTPTPQRYHLRESGYVVAADRSTQGATWLLLDGGSLGAGLHHDATPSTAHGHADTLQVLYITKGRTVLRDPGMPFYFGSRRWVDHFRGPEAHNTIAVEGACQGRHAGRLTWSDVMRQPDVEANLSDELWLARVRAQWDQEVSVVRHVLAIPGRGLWILDSIASPTARRVEWYWQVGADCHDVSEPAALYRRCFTGECGNLHVHSAGSPIHATVDTPNQVSPVGWHAPAYGQLCPARRVRIETVVDGELLVATALPDQPSQFCARVHDHTVGSPDLDDHEWSSHEGENLVWRGTFCSDVITVVAGPAARQKSREWALMESRDWPAAMLVSELRVAT